MKDKLHKVKRPRVNWYLALKNLEDSFIESDYLAFKCKHMLMSKNRAAYNILKRYYSTTALDNYRWLGHFPNKPRSDYSSWFDVDGLRVGFLADDFFEPNDYPEGDIGSATVSDMRIQNGD